jgi:NAD(P)-dependent dehydrogenase (short-subunit alcohol dehydrogenase family)
MSKSSDAIDMNGKVAVVTGGASGMGLLLATRLAKRGAKVAIIDLNDAALSETAAGNPGITPFRCDVADLPAVEATVAQIESRLGPISYLAHAAALMPGISLLDMSAEKINRLMEINYGGTVNTTKSVLSLMRSRRSGQIVIFGSIAGVIPGAGLGAYCATKAAVNFYAETLIHENAGSGVRILLVCPPAVNTPLIRQAVEKGPKALANSAKTGKNMASPESIIDAVEKAIASGRSIIYPGQAAMLQVMRRVSPSLMWKLADMANR